MHIGRLAPRAPAWLALLALVPCVAGVESAAGVVTNHAAPGALAPDAVVEDWPSFLGPRHDGTSAETRLRKTWPAGGPPLVWSMTRGTGYASPAIQAGRLVYAHRVGDEDVVECLHPESGARLWSVRWPTTYRDRYGYNNGPRSSPVLDGDRVYVHSQLGVLRCLDAATGALRWSRDLAADHHLAQDFFGVASTPLVHGGLLVVNVGARGGPGVIGIDKLTGATRWGCDDQWGPSYASPVPAVIHGKPRILVFAGGESRPPIGGLLGIDPETGTLGFRIPWRSISYESVNAACPVVIGDRVFISASYNTGGALVEVAADGTAGIAWTCSKLATHFNTAIHRDGHLYGFHGRNEPDAELVCVEVATGKVAWVARPEWEETVQGRVGTYGPFRGQLLWADGQFLCLGEFGHLQWLTLDPTGWKETARAWLFPATETWSPPVISHGLLYVCQNHRGFSGEPARLLCYDLRAQR